LWAARSTDAWLLGPSKDHYCCNIYYVLETRAYRISGSAELFPQHCQLPNPTPHEHIEALTLELTNETRAAATTPTGKDLIKILRTHLDALLEPPVTEPQQRVIAPTMPPATDVPLQRVTNSPPIMQAQNPTAKQSLLTTTQTHRQQTRSNTPGAVPPITRAALPIVSPDDGPTTPAR
jgi:hypothetical protein